MRIVVSMAALAMLALSSTASQAVELSPWMGSEDQIPFQLDPTTMVAVTFAADPLQTGSIRKRACPKQGCVLATKPAKGPVAAEITPQK